MLFYSILSMMASWLLPRLGEHAQKYERRSSRLQRIGKGHEKKYIQTGSSIVAHPNLTRGRRVLGRSLSTKGADFMFRSRPGLVPTLTG
jgi:hypothetical protein